MNDQLASIAAIIVTLAGVVAQLYNAKSTERKTVSDGRKVEAEAHNVAADTAADVQTIYRNIIADMRARVSALEAQLAEAKAGEAERAETQKNNVARITELERVVSQIEVERASWQREREEWRDGIQKLIEQLERLELKPAWKPKGTNPFKP